MDRHSQIRPSERTIYDLDSLALSQRSSSPLPAPLDLSCHNRHGSPKNTDYDQEIAYDYSSRRVPEINYSHDYSSRRVPEINYDHDIQESTVSTSQQLHYSQYPYDSSHHGLYPHDQEFAYRISSTCSPPTTSSDLYRHHDYHQYRVKPSTSPNPYEANSITYSTSQYYSPQLPYSPAHDTSSWPSNEPYDSAYSASGMNYQPLTVSTSHMSHTGHERLVSPQDFYEPVSPQGLLSPTGSQHSSYGACGGQLSPSHPAHERLGAASECDSRHSSSDSGVSPGPTSTTIPESLARYPKGKARRQKIGHKNLTEEEILQRKRDINNDSSRRHRQRKSLSMKQLEEEEQRELARQVHLTKTRDILKQQTELLGSLIKNVDLNRK